MTRSPRWSGLALPPASARSPGIVFLPIALGFGLISTAGGLPAAGWFLVALAAALTGALATATARQHRDPRSLDDEPRRWLRVYPQRCRHARPTDLRRDVRDASGGQPVSAINLIEASSVLTSCWVNGSVARGVHLHFWRHWRHTSAMTSVQIKGVPEQTHAVLRERAARAHQSFGGVPPRRTRPGGERADAGRGSRSRGRPIWGHVDLLRDGCAAAGRS